MLLQSRTERMTNAVSNFEHAALWRACHQLLHSVLQLQQPNLS